MRLPSFRPVRLAVPMLAVALLGGSSAVHAQALRGTLLGTITDTTGATVPGVTVTAIETRTNIARNTSTNESGNYVFTNLQDGLYRVEAELSGFNKMVRDGVPVKVNTTVRVDLLMQVGALAETVEVVQTAPLLQTDRADTGRLLESKQVTEMPLGFNRNFQGLMITVPGSTRPSRPHSEFFNPQDSLETKVNGQSRLSNNVQIEGVDNNHKTGLLTVLIPAADSIDSVSVSTSNFDAEFGRAGGAVTSVTLKSGTNEFKGSAFFFGNTEGTRARPYFSAPDSAKPPTEYQQYGFTIGGPIRRNKLFFFADYQRTVDNLGKFHQHVIPAMAWRNGDFSSASTVIYDPATGNPDGTGRQPFPGNVIPANRISPIARALLGFLPAPNVAAAIGQNNYRLNTTREKDTHAFNVKLNYQATDRDSLSFRLSFQRPEIFDPGSYGIYGGPANGAFAGSGYQNTYSTALNYTRTFGSSLIMEARAGFSYYHNEALSEAHGLKTADEVGIRGVNLDDFSSGIPRFEVGGFSSPMLGFSGSLPWDRWERTALAAATVTKISGNHTLKVGGEVRYNRDMLLQIQDNGGTRGRYAFNGARTAIPTDNAAINGLANSFASFLLDAPSLVSRDVKVLDTPGTQHWGFFTFIHDKWQVTPKLTLDLGLRHEYYTPLRGLVDRGGLANYDPDTNTVRVAGYGDVSQNVGVKNTWSNFAPRLGISYRINDRTVARAGFGTSIIPFPDNRYAFNFPVKQNNQFNAPNSFAPAGSMAAPFPAAEVFEIPASGIVSASHPQLRSAGLFHVPSDLEEAKIHSWNLAFQRELVWGFTGEVAYVGNVGRGVLADFNLNAGMVLGADNAGRPLFQGFGRTASVRTWWPTNTNYHSLQAKLDRRFSNGLLVTTSYTLGRATDNSGADNGGIGTPADISRFRGRANFDRTHSFAQSFVWEVPLARDGQGLAKWLLNGWQLSGIFVAQSGTPVNITTSSATLRAPGNDQTPNLNGKSGVFGDIGPGQLYFDTSVFSAPAPATWGNLTRNSSGIRGPGYVNLDASLVKRFNINGRMYAELRADAFNVTNSPQFNNPNGTFGNPNFGQVTGAFGERLVRFGARFAF